MRSFIINFAGAVEALDLGTTILLDFSAIDELSSSDSSLDDSVLLAHLLSREFVVAEACAFAVVIADCENSGTSWHGCEEAAEFV